MPSQLLDENDRRHAWYYSVNGVAAPIWRRSVRHGDVIQVLPKRVSPPVWSAGSVLDFFPEARGMLVPMSLLDVERPPDGMDDAAIGAHNVASIQGQLEFFLAGRLDMMGRPGRCMQHVLLQGPTHGDLLLHLNLPLSPSAAQLEEFLLGCDFWDSSLLIHDTKHVLGPVSIFASSQPNVRALTALVPSTTVDNLIVVQLDPDQPELSGHVFWKPHLHPAAIRSLRQGMFIHMKHRDLPRGEGLCLLQTGVQIRKAPRAALPDGPATGHVNEPLRQADLTAGEGPSLLQDGATLPKTLADATPGGAKPDGTGSPKVAIPTPWGRRTIPSFAPSVQTGCNSLVQGPVKRSQLPDVSPSLVPDTAACDRRRVFLDRSVPEPRSGAAWGVNREIVEHALAAHRLPLADLVPSAVSLPPVASRTWRSITECRAQQPIEAVILYTDGSFDPRSYRASWSLLRWAVRMANFVGSAPWQVVCH